MTFELKRILQTNSISLIRNAVFLAVLTIIFTATPASNAFAQSELEW